MQTLHFIAFPSVTASESASSAAEPTPVAKSRPAAATTEPSALQSTLVAVALAHLARLLPSVAAGDAPLALHSPAGQVLVHPLLAATAALVVHLRFPFQNKTNYTNQFK